MAVQVTIKQDGVRRILLAASACGTEAADRSDPADYFENPGADNVLTPKHTWTVRKDNLRQRCLIMTYEFDLGSYSRPVTTSSPEAQLWFDRGLLWTYGSNHSL